MRRRLSICQHMRHASAIDGGASSVSLVSRVCARELVLLHAAARLGQGRAREHEEHGRDREDEERDAPAERLRDVSPR